MEAVVKSNLERRKRSGNRPKEAGGHAAKESGVFGRRRLRPRTIDLRPSPRYIRIEITPAFLTILWIFAAFALPLTAGRQDWRWYKPRIRSQVRQLQRAEAGTLLANFCDEKVRSDAVTGLTCRTRQLGPAFADIVDRQFQPEGVIFGHFTAPDSDDAAISGSSMEAHPYLSGGTLLLTRKGGKWIPVWYKSAVITSACRVVTAPNRRDLLLCEVEDGGMGHQLHYVFPVDLNRPADVRKTLLATANSYESSCLMHRQRIQRVDWITERRQLSITIATPEWRRISRDICAGDPSPVRRPAVTAILQFDLTDRGFVPNRQP